MELLRKQRLKALRRTTSSRNLGNNSRSQSMRSIVDSEKSSRPRTPVNFNTNTSGFTQSSRIQLDEEDYSTKKSENNNPDWVNTLRTNCIVFLRYVTQFDYISSQFSAFGKRITREVMRSGIVVWIKLQQRLLIDAIWPPEVDEFGVKTTIRITLTLPNRISFRDKLDTV